MTTACVVLGTLAVLSGGRGGSSSRHTRSGDLATELLRTAHDTSYDYDPSKDFCYTDTDNAGKYCWYPTDHYPCGNWDGEGGHGYHNCGRLCTQVMAALGRPKPFPFQAKCLSVVYDPDLDYCFKDNDNAGKYCWSEFFNIPYGNWESFLPGWIGGRDFNDCGPKCKY